MANKTRSLTRMDKRGMLQKFWGMIVILFVINALILIAINALFFNLEQRQKLSDIDNAIVLTKQFIQHDFDSNLANIEFLSQSQPIKSYVSSSIESTYGQIEDLFVNLAKTSTLYSQIRLLDLNGQELVRVDYRDGMTTRILRSQLQKKSERYYFKNTIALANGGVYTSPLDLNVEQGVIERPFLPMMRYGKPLYDENNNLKGALILNYFGTVVLDIFRDQMKAIPSQAMLINKDGYWLSHPNPDHEWGFMLNNNHKLSTEQPQLWTQITQGESGNTVIGDNRYIWQLVKNQYSDISPLSDDWKIVVVDSAQLFSLSKAFSQLTFLYPAFIIYIIGLLLVWLLAKNHVLKKKAQRELIGLNGTLKQIVAERTKELMVTKDITIMSMATLAETRDNETGQHLRRTQNYVKALADELSNHPKYQAELNADTIQQMFKSTPLHDIGKVAIPDRILLKPGRLTPQEFQVMKQHTTHGSNAISFSIKAISRELSLAQDSTFLNIAREIAHFHHERWDGSGYPSGLKGEDIPLSARIMAIADVFDALACKRVYKESYDRERTEKIMLDGRGSHFDPLIFDIFWEIRDEFWAIKERYADFISSDEGHVAEDHSDRLTKELVDV